MFSRSKVAVIVAEFLGTALLTTVVLAVSRSSLGLPYFVASAAGLTLGVTILTLGGISGAHLNPAVTLGLWTVRRINTTHAVVYVIAQFLGALSAWRLYEYLTNSELTNIAGTSFDWRVLAAEAIGTFVFVFGVTAAIYQKYEGVQLAAAIGVSLFLGVLIAAVALNGNGVVNPAVALGIQSWSRAYVVGPLVGALVGANLYHYVFADVPRPVKAVARSKKK